MSKIKFRKIRKTSAPSDGQISITIEEMYVAGNHEVSHRVSVV